MTKFLNQLSSQFLILHRNRLIIISLVLTILYVAILLLLQNLPNVEQFLVLLIYNDPAIIGLFFVGLSVIMEKNDGVLVALFVTPINHHHYLISRILSLSIIGTLCAVGMGLALTGEQWNLAWWPFVAGVFFTCIIFSIVGVMLVSYSLEFLHFMLRSIPFLLGLSLPLLNYFQLTDIALFQVVPIQGPLNLIISGFGHESSHGQIVLSIAMSTGWIIVLYALAHQIFRRRIIKMRLT